MLLYGVRPRFLGSVYTFLKQIVLYCTIDESAKEHITNDMRTIIGVFGHESDPAEALTKLSGCDAKVLREIEVLRASERDHMYYDAILNQGGSLLLLNPHGDAEAVRAEMVLQKSGVERIVTHIS